MTDLLTLQAVRLDFAGAVSGHLHARWYLTAELAITLDVWVASSLGIFASDGGRWDNDMDEEFHRGIDQDAWEMMERSEVLELAATSPLCSPALGMPEWVELERFHAEAVARRDAAAEALRSSPELLERWRGALLDGPQDAALASALAAAVPGTSVYRDDDEGPQVPTLLGQDPATPLCSMCQGQPVAYVGALSQVRDGDWLNPPGGGPFPLHLCEGCGYEAIGGGDDDDDDHPQGGGGPQGQQKPLSTRELREACGYDLPVDDDAGD